MNRKTFLKQFLNKFYNFTPLPKFEGNYFNLIKEINQIEKIQYFNRKNLNDYQNFHFRKLIIHAYNNVQFYKLWFRNNNLYLTDVKKVSDIKRLPILTKDLIRKNFHKFISINFKKYKPHLQMTSGSTGVPFKFFIDKYANIRYRASIWRILRTFNVKFSDKQAILRGTLVKEHGQQQAFLWKFNFLSKSIAFNTFHLNEINCKKIISQIIQFKPKLLMVYPMALYTLSLYIKKYGISFPSLKMILSSSESFSQEHRDFISKTFKCPFIDLYGQSELALHAYECKPVKGYHVVEENNILELLDKNHQEVSEGELGRIIGTNLFNFSMPLIRYSTEDLAIMGGDECACGRNTKKLKSIQGRILDQIITEDKSIISGISFYHYWKHIISEKIPNISYIQLIQPKIDEIIVKIIPDKKYNQNEEKTIINELKKFIGNLKISFKYITKREDAQKWRFTVSNLSSKEIIKYL